jgi:high-affinity iron transporter
MIIPLLKFVVLALRGESFISGGQFMSRTFIKPKSILICVAAVLVIGVLVWQGITAHGDPDPTVKHLSPSAAMLDTGILVFREGLEAILVLSALTASLVRTQNDAWKPISIGAGLSFLATLITWFVVVGVINLAGGTTSELNIQAATGLLANVVLLVIMNWFFHKIYWTGWISLHNRKKRELMETSSGNDVQAITYKGLVILGLTSMYREGFEVVLFLQTIRMQVGSHVVLLGTLIGLGCTMLVAVLTFIAHQRLPYKKMLILTGIMLCVVLFVMTGETVQEMQQAGWIPTTNLGWNIPDWMGLWFSVVPTVQTLVAQVLAVIFVVGSYVVSEYVRVRKPRKQVRSAALKETQEM